ncbi:MAG: MBL fold metallo-hydrolase, partial [Bacteroidales bacterium]
MTFSVTILGSSSALPTINRFPSAHVVNSHERLFLLDCAEGTQIQLRKYRLNMNRIDHIFISHLHGDHVLGIFGLISTLNLIGRKTPLNIYA